MRAVAVDTAEKAVAGADVLILATNSSVPVIESSWVEPGTHVITMGPKFAGRHELPVSLASRAKVIVTDSLSQLHGYEKPYFLKQSPDYSRIVEVGSVILGKELGRTTAEDITLFLSVGTGGSEVLVADAVINNKIKMFY